MKENYTYKNLEETSNTPQLRFPGFTGEWTEKKLGDCLDYEQPQEYLVESDNYVSNGIPVLTAGKTFILGYTKEKEGVFNNLPVIIFDDFTTASKFVDFPFKAKSSAMKMLLPKKDVNLRFVYESMQLVKYQADDHKRHWISFYSNIPILLPPSLAEQQKIADCLSSLDDMIRAVGQKTEALREYKRGLMQQLFPANGATTPQLRFPGFTGEWKFVNGDKLFAPITNKEHNSDLPILALTQEQGAVPRDMINYNVIVSDKSVAGYKVVEIGDFIISLRSFQGGIEYSQYKGLCSPAYIVLRKKDAKLVSDFYRIYFKSYNYIQELTKNLEGIRDGKMISYQQFSETKLPLPSPSEQQKIADCLSSLDDMISAQAQKTETLREYKRGLMQQLFPQPSK